MLFYKVIWHINCFLKKIFLKIIYGNKIKFGKNVQFRKRFNICIEKNAKIIIGNNTFFNNDCSINAMNKVIVGDNCMIGENVKIYDHDHKFKENKKLIREQGFSIGEVSIDDNCWICSNVIVLKNSKIDKNSVIAAGTIVKNNVSSNSLVYQEKNTKIKKVKNGD